MRIKPSDRYRTTVLTMGVSKMVMCNGVHPNSPTRKRQQRWRGLGGYLPAGAASRSSAGETASWRFFYPVLGAGSRQKPQFPLVADRQNAYLLF